MHIDTYRQEWQALRRCRFSRESWPSPEQGRIASIGIYEGDGVCAKVEFGPYKFTEWYVCKKGHISKMGYPRGQALGIVPPGCW